MKTPKYMTPYTVRCSEWINPQTYTRLSDAKSMAKSLARTYPYADIKLTDKFRKIIFEQLSTDKLYAMQDLIEEKHSVQIKSIDFKEDIEGSRYCIIRWDEIMETHDTIIDNHGIIQTGIEPWFDKSIDRLDAKHSLIEIRSIRTL